MNGGEVAGDFIGTGMHGGQMFLRGEVDPRRLGREVKIGEVTGEDTKLLKKHVGDFCAYFGFDLDKIFKKPFTKIYPYSHRPYGTIYAY
jgi:glutamate synthase domain-containing protein 3